VSIRAKATAVAAFVFVLALALMPMSGVAQAGRAKRTATDAAAVIDSTTVENGYPTQLVFKASAHADTQITGMVLSYELTGETAPTLTEPDKFAAGKSVAATATVPVNSSSNYIPVGSELSYHWEVTTSDGTKSNSAEQKFVFLPPDQQWQTLSNAFMTIYYHSGISDIAAKYLAAADDSYASMGKLLGATLPLIPVRVVLFNTESESARARPAPGGPVDAPIAACGLLPALNDILILPNACATSDMTDTLRHELSHILVAAASGGGLGGMPAWLDEGTALYAQSNPGGNFTAAFAAAAKADALLPFDTVATAPIDLTKTALFYGQSYAMVKYLIDNGTEKFSSFFAKLKGGDSFDSAFQETYGFDLEGFQAAFRSANGLPVDAPTPTPPGTPARATSSATAAGGQASTSSNGGISRTAVLIFAAALAFLVLAVMAYLLLIFIQSGRHEPRS